MKEAAREMDRALASAKFSKGINQKEAKTVVKETRRTSPTHRSATGSGWRRTTTARTPDR